MFVDKERFKTILTLALPIAAGMASTFVMMVVDLAMVGALGNTALAALGLGSFSIALLLAFVMGVTPAVQGMVARRVGEQSTEARCLPLNAGLLFVLIIAIPLSVICFFFSHDLFDLISSDPDVIREGVPYFQAMIVAIPAVGMNNAFGGFWNGLSRPKVFMLNALFMNCLNVFLNYVLIYGNFGAPALGTLGSGVASAISLYAGLLVYTVITFVHYRSEGFLKYWPKATLLGQVFQVGVPATFQHVFFSLGYIVFYYIIGLVGTAELAVMNVLVRVALLTAIFAEALGVAAATLVAESLGKGDTDGASRWGWDIGKIGVLWITLLGMPLLLFPEWVLSFFLVDPATLSMAVIPAQLTGALTGITSLIIIFAIPLVSVGDGKRVLMVSFSTQWFIFLPLVWLIGPYLNYGLLEISYVQYAYGLIAAAIITSLWSGGKWKSINNT